MQVVYILDQVRALENEMLENLQLQGLDIIPQIVIVRPNLSSSSFIPQKLLILLRTLLFSTHFAEILLIDQ